MLHTRKFKLSLITMLALLGVAGFTSVNVNAATTSTTISSTLGSVISLLSSNGTVNINATPTGDGVQTIASDTVTVSTNATAGYTLQLGETTASSDLESGSDTIPAIAGATIDDPAPLTANSWGYRVDNTGSFSAGTTSPVSNGTISGTIDFAAVPATASPDTLKTTATTAANDTTTVWYGIAVDTTAASGTYTNSVTYTATVN